MGCIFFGIIVFNKPDVVLCILTVDSARDIGRIKSDAGISAETADEI
jgi:hypothetical protein